MGKEGATPLTYIIEAPMNVKFKMPKFGRKWTGKAWWKELLMTFLGTTISIVLTFGTSHLLDQKAKKKAGRQMAMMVIHDIDDEIQNYKDWAQKEKEAFEVAQYVMGNLDKTDSMSKDTLNTIYNMLFHLLDFTLDDSKERIFNSSPETWKNIDNPKFIDIVQRFYYERRNYHTYTNTDPSFREPYSAEDEFKLVMEVPNRGDRLEVLKYVVSKSMRDPRVLLYFEYTPARVRFYDHVVQEWKQKSDQCKFLMGITDDELKEYVEKNNRTGRTVKEHELIGKWALSMSSDNHVETIEFFKDHTFLQTYIKKTQASFYLGSISAMMTMPGKWSLVGDTLVKTYLPGTTIKLDTSDVTYIEEMKDSAQSYIKYYEKLYAKENEKYKKKPFREENSYGVLSIDRSGEKIEVIQVTTDEEGEEDNEPHYMLRTKD